MKPYDYNQDSKFGLKVLFDLSFFIVINTIIMNIVAGIIIDTFGEMRDQLYERQEKLSNTCLICQNIRSSIEEIGVNFKVHVSKDHDLWLYLEFMKYIKVKRRVDYTADEVAIYSDLENKTIDWMPQGSSVFLKGLGDEDEDLIKEIDKKVDGLDSRLSDLQKMLNQKFANSDEKLQQISANVLKIMQSQTPK